MKRNQLYLLLLCMALGSPVFGQFFEKNFQVNFYNQALELRTGTGGEVFMTTRNESQSNLGPVIMHHMDTAGNAVSFWMLTYGEALDYDWLPVDNGFVSTGHFWDCDVFITRRFFRHDLNGFLLWEKEESPDIPWFLPVEETKLLPGLNGTFWVCKGDKPRLYSGGGDPIGTGPLAVPLFSGYIRLPDDVLVTYGTEGLARYSPGLNGVQLGLFGYDILKAVRMPDGRYVVMTQNQLLITDEDFVVEKEIAHGQPDVKDVAASGNRILLLCSDLPKKILRFDTTLALIETVTIPTEAVFQPSLCAIDGQRLIVAGEEYDPDLAQVAGVRALPLDTTFSFEGTCDAALTGIQVPKPPKGSGVSDYHQIVFDSVTVTLKNEGIDTLHNVAINAILGHYNIGCPGLAPYHQIFYDLNLLPQTSKEIYIGKIVQFGTFSVPAQTQLCFWTTLPNDSLDLDRTNNRTCQSFNVIVNAPEPPPMVSLQISPNPASDAFTLNWSSDVNARALARLFDAAGRQVIETQVSSGRWTFQRGALPAGLYNLLLTDDKGRVYSGKLVLE
jgi:hypothetical protein